MRKEPLYPHVPGSRSKEVRGLMRVETRSSRIVGAMAWETPYIVFIDYKGQTYVWTSDTIETWENGTWPKWDARRGHKFNLREGNSVNVSAFVRPDGKTLFRVNLSP